MISARSPDRFPVIVEDEIAVVLHDELHVATCEGLAWAKALTGEQVVVALAGRWVGKKDCEGCGAEEKGPDNGEDTHGWLIN